VGRTDFDTIGGVQGLVSVGGGLNPNLEALVGLEPDLVIRFAGESDQSTPTRLDEMGIRHISFRPDRMTDVRDLVQGLGLLTDRSAQAHALLAEMDATLREIEEKLLGRPLVRVAYVLGGNPPWVAGPETFIHELLAAAGGENVFQDLEGLYGPVSMEEFLVRDIHVLLVPMGAELSLPFADLPVVRVSPTLELPGPDLAQGVRDLAKILHPEAFR
jgi:iron complex transport system substrate-binding protein